MSGVGLGEIRDFDQQGYPGELPPPLLIEEEAPPLGEGGSPQAEEDPERAKRQAPHLSLVPRAGSSPALAAPLSGKGMDVVFAIHWEIPSTVRLRTPQEEECFKKQKMAPAQPGSNSLGRLEVDIVSEKKERECLEPGLFLDSSQSPRPALLTIRRTSIECTCPFLKGSETCSEPLPLQNQPYPRRSPDVYFKFRNSPTLSA